jgi:phosphoglycolate phosphatase
MMKIDTFLFDLDGTLVDSVADIATSVNLLRREIGLEPLSLPDVGTRVGDGARRLVERSLPDGMFSDDSFRLFLRLYEEHVCEETYLYPGIMDFLDGHQSCRMAIVTNKPSHLSEKLLQKLGVRDRFAAVLGPECCPAKKPDPAPVLEALRILKADPESAVMIGDHHTDLIAGREAGVKTCFCAWGIGEDGDVAYDFRAETPADLMKHFPA